MVKEKQTNKQTGQSIQIAKYAGRKARWRITCRSMSRKIIKLIWAKVKQQWGNMYRDKKANI